MRSAALIVLGGDRQLVEALAGRVGDGVENGRRHRDHHELGDPFRNVGRPERRKHVDLRGSRPEGRRRAAPDSDRDSRCRCRARPRRAADIRRARSRRPWRSRLPPVRRPAPARGRARIRARSRHRRWRPRRSPCRSRWRRRCRTPTCSRRRSARRASAGT